MAAKKIRIHSCIALGRVPGVANEWNNYRPHHQWYHSGRYNLETEKRPLNSSPLISAMMMIQLNVPEFCTGRTSHCENTESAMVTRRRELPKNVKVTHNS